MQKGLDWRLYIDSKGDFELAHYLYKVVSCLMKTSLDLGTLLSDDPSKLRAYKEQVKSAYKDRWMELAKALEEFDIIVPCDCKATDFCRKCGGSRFILNSALSPDRLSEIAFITTKDSKDIMKKLEKGLDKAIAELS